MAILEAVAAGVILAVLRWAANWLRVGDTARRSAMRSVATTASPIPTTATRTSFRHAVRRALREVRQGPLRASWLEALSHASGSRVRSFTTPSILNLVPPKQWTFHQQDAWDALRRSGGRGAHAVWALLAVESLFYLADADDHTFTAQTWYGSSPDAIDIAHVSAAAGNAVAALDRCAAELAEIHGVTNKSGNAVSLAQLQPNSTHADVNKRRSKLSAGALAWVDAAWGDPDYQRVRDRRHPLLHAHIARDLHRPVNPGHNTRTKFGGINARDLILVSRDVADRHVDRFLTAMIAGQLTAHGQVSVAFP
jgi:hypothetical protein